MSRGAAVPEAELPPSLAILAAQNPGITFGPGSYDRPAGPPPGFWWANVDGVMIHAGSPADLAALVEVELAGGR